jgi:hypothetical protein
MEASKALKELQSQKTKLDNPTFATMENILLKYEISPARYLGDKLNEVDCQELMYKAVTIFEEVEELCSPLTTHKAAPVILSGNDARFIAIPSSHWT